MLNSVIIQGRLTRDPELRRTNSGTAVASFTIACDRDFKSADGNRETDFVEVVCWKNTAEFAEKYFSKGQQTVIAGRLQVRSYTDKDGNKRKAVEVVADNLYFCGDKEKKEEAEFSDLPDEGYLPWD